MNVYVVSVRLPISRRRSIDARHLTSGGPGNQQFGFTELEAAVRRSIDARRLVPGNEQATLSG